MPIQQKLTPPVLLFSDFAGRVTRGVFSESAQGEKNINGNFGMSGTVKKYYYLQIFDNVYTHLGGPTPWFLKKKKALIHIIFATH